MQNQDAIQYIQQHMQQGHTEAAISDHLKNNGWAPEVIDQAFRDYYAVTGSHTPTPVEPPIPLARKSNKKWLVLPLALIVVLVVALIIHLVTSPKALNKLAQPAMERNSRNVARETDANMIVSAIGNYMSAHGGNLPQSVGTDTVADVLDICGTSCGADKTTASLTVYKPDAVKYHAYTNGLTVSDTNSIYIVNNANCNTGNGGIGSQTQTGQTGAVVLYAIESGSSIQQKCVGL